MNDTIAAIATGLTPSGIGIVRLSGPDALKVIAKVFKGKTGPDEWKPYSIHYGNIYSRGTLIDEVLVMNMRAPHSYTGEDTIEIDCHGGPLMMRKILEAVTENGARIAQPGEFTKRAFLNGRIDLSQAESVIDIINATNENSRKASVMQLKGSVSGAVKALRDKIIRNCAFIESALDDPENYTVDKNALRDEIKDIRSGIDELLKTYSYGKVIKEGINTCIIGKPNAGKSSLLNALLGEERAIVTEVPGTTRDVITESVVIGNLTLNIMDTAGLRDTDDLVESIGVKKAYENAKNADLILYVLDMGQEPDEDICAFLRENSLKTIFIYNKCDLYEVKTQDTEYGKACPVSAKTGDGITELTEMIRSMFEEGSISLNDQVVVTNARHAELLHEASDALGKIDLSMTEDFYTIDLMDAYRSLGLIIGEETEDDLCDRIFSEFCMGK